MHRYELTLTNEPGALAHVVALITGRRWTLGSLHLPSPSQPDRRELIIDLEGRPDQIEAQLGKLYDVLGVKKVV